MRVVVDVPDNAVSGGYLHVDSIPKRRDGRRILPIIEQYNAPEVANATADDPADPEDHPTLRHTYQTPEPVREPIPEPVESEVYDDDDS